MREVRADNETASSLLRVIGAFRGIVPVLKRGCRWCDCSPEYGPRPTNSPTIMAGGFRKADAVSVR
jgi:hypothetical protein